MMERSDQIQSPTEVLRKIKGFIRTLLVDIGYNYRLSVAVDRHRTYCSNSSGNCFCSSNLQHGFEILSLEKEGHACRLYILLRILMIIQQLLQENKHGSKRDIYYMEPSVFTDQAVVNRAINDICILLKCSRHHLNVVPVGRGLIMGCVRFMEAGRIISCITSPSTAYMIPVSVEEVEGTWMKWPGELNNMGRGYPDVPTRRFLQRLIKQLHLPVYCLVDFDPYGFDILTTYRFGSTQMAYDAKLMRVSEIRWLGAFSSDFEKYQLPGRCLLSLTSDDKKKAEAMLSRCYLHQEASQWRLELEIMLHKGVKFEIEALSSSSLSFLADVYIPLKIQEGGYI